MPFVTEEIFHLLREDQKVDLCVRQLDSNFTKRAEDSQVLHHADLLKSAITAIRDARVKAQLKNKDAVQIHLSTQNQAQWDAIRELLCKQVNADAFVYTDANVPDSIQLVLGADRIFITTEKELDTEAQRKELEAELEYYQGFLNSVEKKLGNEKFVQNAKPEVVDIERKKQSDALGKINLLQESLKNLKG